MNVMNLTTEKFEETIKQNDIVILDFWAEWCGPCKQFAPVFEAAAEKYDNILFAKVNVEEQEALAGLFQVRSIPTLVFMREEIVLYSNPGALPANSFEEVIQQVLELDMKQVHKDKAKAEAEAAAEEKA